jgi:hypothetical protein
MVRARPFAGGTSLLTIVYLVVGAIVAAQHHYFANLGTFKLLVSGLLALLLWPLVLLGVNLHVH